MWRGVGKLLVVFPCEGKEMRLGRVINNMGDITSMSFHVGAYGISWFAKCKNEDPHT